MAQGTASALGLTHTDPKKVKFTQLAGHRPKGVAGCFFLQVSRRLWGSSLPRISAPIFICRTHSETCSASLCVRSGGKPPDTPKSHVKSHVKNNIPPAPRPPWGAWQLVEATMSAPKNHFAICRVVKIKTWQTLGKSVGHNLRTSSDTRSHLNPNIPDGIQILAGDTGWIKPWKKTVGNMHLRELGQGCRHTLAREFIFSFSPGHFDHLFSHRQAAIDQWAAANLSWLRERFGHERVKLVVQHNDEQTEHIAAYIVPLKADLKRDGTPHQRGNGWTLSDASIGLGGKRDELATLQTEYAAAMEKFGLVRGIKGSKATHQTTARWRKQMAKPLEEKINVPAPIAATLSDRVNIEDYGKRVAKAAGADVYRQMKPYHQQAKAQGKSIKEKDEELRELRQRVSRLEPLADAFKQLVAVLLGREVNLNSLQGLEMAIKAIKQLIKAVKPDLSTTPRQPPEIARKRPIAAPPPSNRPAPPP